MTLTIASQSMYMYYLYTIMRVTIVMLKPSQTAVSYKMFNGTSYMYMMAVTKHSIEVTKMD